MKKILSILLALAMMLMGVAALAEEGAALPMGDPVWLYNDLEFSIYVEGALEGDVTIPANINEHAAYALNFNALCDQNAVTSLTLPDCMYVLRDNAISHMAGLQSVTLNEGLEVICDTNFNNCPSLTSVTIPASVRLIDEAFKNCESLREIRFEGECPIFLGLDWIFHNLAEDYVIYVPDDQYDAYAEALANADDGVITCSPAARTP